MTTTRHSAEGTVHSAAGNSGEHPEGANAPARGRPREATRDSAQSAPNSAATFSDAMGRVVAHFSPPDIVEQDRPSLRKAWAYASRGAWTGETGLPRTFGRGFGVFVLIKKTLIYELDFYTDTPARFAAALGLFALLDQFPPLLWLIDIDKLPPLVWLLS